MSLKWSVYERRTKKVFVFTLKVQIENFWGVMLASFLEIQLWCMTDSNWSWISSWICHTSSVFVLLLRVGVLNFHLLLFAFFKTNIFLYVGSILLVLIAIFTKRAKEKSKICLNIYKIKKSLFVFTGKTEVKNTFFLNKELSIKLSKINAIVIVPGWVDFFIVFFSQSLLPHKFCFKENTTLKRKRSEIC